MDLALLVHLSGVPYLGAAIELLQMTYKGIEDVKIYKKRCADLSRRCLGLMVALREGVCGLEGERVVSLADEIEIILFHINRRVTEWRSWNYLKSFLMQGDIKEGIDMFHLDIDAAEFKFGIRVNLELTRGQLESKAIQARDHAELRDLLERILLSTECMKALFYGSDSRPIEAMMETLKEELSDSSLGSTKGELFEMRLRELRHTSAAAPSNYHHHRRRSRNGARLLETSSSEWSRKSAPENSAAPQYFGTAASGSTVTKTKETIAGAGRTAGREAAPTKETPVERVQVGISRNKGKMKEGYVEYNAAPAKHRIPTETHETGWGHRSNHNMATKRKDGPREDVIPVKHRVLVKAQSSKTRIPFPAAATTKAFSVGRSENKDGRASVEDMMWAQRVKSNAATEVSHVHGAVTKVGRSMSSTRALNMPVDTGTLKKATAKAGGSMSVSNGGSKRTKGGRH